MKGGGLVGNLLSPALSSTSVWRRGRRGAVSLYEPAVPALTATIVLLDFFRNPGELEA
jgi:hypothetical protein